MLLLLLSCKNEVKLEKFDTEKWKTGTQLERGNMATDLVESTILIGKNKTEVISILGQPKDSTITNFHYIIDYGYMTKFHLDISFDINKLKVIKTEISD